MGTGRRYYLDLKENMRGRFLKISMTMAPPSFERAQIVIPAQGMVDLRDALTDLLAECGKGSPGAMDDSATEEFKGKPAGPPKEEAGLALKTGSKTVYVAVTNNKHGVNLKISEVSPNFRTAVNIPEAAWEKFLVLLKKKALERGNGATGDVKQEDSDM